MRLAPIVLAVALLCGCGGSEDSTMTGPHMGGEMQHMGNASMATMRASWMANPACAHPQGASRWGCSVGPYRCQAVVSDRGWSVDCAKPGRSIAFTVPPRK